MAKDNKQNDPDSSGSDALDSVNEAAKSVLGPSDTATEKRGGYVEPNPDPRDVAAAHGDRLITDAHGETVIIEDPEAPGR